MDKMSAMAAVRAGYASGVQPLGIARTFDENARAPIRTSDIVVSATVIPATTTVTLATVPAGENWRIEHLAVLNASGTSATLHVYLIPAGGSANIALNGIQVVTSFAGAASVIPTMAIGYQLAAGESLAVRCNTAAANFVAVARLTRITQGAT